MPASCILAKWVCRVWIASLSPMNERLRANLPKGAVLVTCALLMLTLIFKLRCKRERFAAICWVGQFLSVHIPPATTSAAEQPGRAHVRHLPPSPPLRHCCPRFNPQETRAGASKSCCPFSELAASSNVTRLSICYAVDWPEAVIIRSESAGVRWVYIVACKRFGH